MIGCPHNDIIVYVATSLFIAWSSLNYCSKMHIYKYVVIALSEGGYTVYLSLIQGLLSDPYHQYTLQITYGDHEGSYHLVSSCHSWEVYRSICATNPSASISELTFSASTFSIYTLFKHVRNYFQKWLTIYEHLLIIQVWKFSENYYG